MPEFAVFYVGSWGKVALASGEQANNRKKARKVYCPQDYYLLLFSGAT